jgi:hypothetical protein
MYSPGLQARCDFEATEDIHHHHDHHQGTDKQPGLRREKWRGLLVVEESRQPSCVRGDMQE